MRASGRAFLLLLLALGSCHETKTSPNGGLHLRPPPKLGHRLLVIAPHPDDEVLGAGGLADATVRSGGDLRVVVVTDGDAGPDATGARNLAAARRAETRRALIALGAGSDAAQFLGYADGSLAAAWTEAWTTSRRHGEPASAEVLSDALRAALRDTAADTVIVPMALDENPDHRAVNRFAMLAVAGLERGMWPRILGYLIHAPGWPANPAVVRAGCAGALFPWTGLLLEPDAVARKAALVSEYRTQLGTRRLFRFARPIEPYAREDVIRAPAAMTPTRPGVHRTPDAIVIRVPRAPCDARPDAGDRLRLRFFDDGGVAERVVDLWPVSRVRGGTPGRLLASARDVSVRSTERSVRLELRVPAFRAVAGGLLEVLPARETRTGPAWVLGW